MVTLQEEEERMTRYQEEMLTRVMELHQVIRARSSSLQTNCVVFLRMDSGDPNPPPFPLKM